MLTRFAPSPTGYLHIGNVRTALLCYLYARKEGGTFLLRIDDTDTERSKEEYVEAVKEDLSWLGIAWDKFARQSERLESYRAAVKKLQEAGRLYVCYETEQELEIKRKMQLSRGQPPVYDREALKLTETQKQKFEQEGRKPHYRFLLEDCAVRWDDRIKGEVTIEGRHASDPILVRENGAFTYMLPSTVDDIELGATHVLRGEDHVNNTAIQIQIFEALGAQPPLFAHNALIKTPEGKLSKRKGASTVRALREEGIEPMTVNSFLAKIGTSNPVDIRFSLKELAAEFDISKFSRSPTTYLEDDIYRLNTKLLHGLDYMGVLPRLKALGFDKVDESFWLAVCPNIETLNDVKLWWDICKEPLSPAIEEPEFLAQAERLLPEGEITADTWNQWMDALKKAAGRGGKALFMPIRKALTGLDHGPELRAMLPLMGRERICGRLRGRKI